MLLLALTFSWRLWFENRRAWNAVQAKETALEEARRSNDRAEDHLELSLYEQARTLALLGTPGSRWQILEWARRAEQLRSRRRESDRSVDGTADLDQLPSRAALRSLAVKALLTSDIRLVRQMKLETDAQPGLSSDGRFAVFASGSAVVLLDATRCRELGRWDQPGLLGTALAIDSTGTKFASWNSQSDVLAVWDIAAKTQRTTLRWPGRANLSRGNSATGGQLLSSELAWSPNGKFLTAIDHRPGEEETIARALGRRHRRFAVARHDP